MKLCSRTVTLALAAGAVAVAAAPARAQDWTRFRGPNGTGVSTATTVPTECTEATRNWRVQLPGSGHSSPVVWGTRVFVTSADAAAGKRSVLCLNTADGKTLWSRAYDVAPYRYHRLNSLASSTPAVDKDRVYVVWPTPDAVTVHALDHSGRELWMRDLGKFTAQHGGASSPVLFNDILILRNDSDEGGPESFVIGLDARTGMTRWKQARIGKTASYSTPVIYQPQGGPAELVFTSNAHGVTSLDPLTGEVNWEMTGVFKQRCVGGPVLARDVVFATAGNGAGERQGVAIRPGSKKGGVVPKIAFEVPRGVPYVPTPVALGDLIFLWGDAGIVACVRASTGEQVWMERVGGNFYGSPVCVNGKLYAMGTRGELVVLEASEQFKVLARSDLGEASHSTPAVSDGVMYLRTESHLISFGGKK